MYRTFCQNVANPSLVMRAGSAPYTSFHSNLTTAVLAGILLVAKGTKFKLSSDSSKDYLLTWNTAATSTALATKSVMFSSGSKTLPINEVITGSTGGGTTKFSKWSVHVVEKAPATADTITYAKVTG